MSSKSLFGMTAVACASVMLFGGCATPQKKTFGGKGIEGEPDWNKTGGELSTQPTKPGDKIGVTFENVLFDYDSAKIKNSEYSKIETVATYLNGNSRTYAVLEGHCDERGTAEYNMTLGERRADAVRAHLLGLRIDGSRLFTKSLGKEQPLDPGHSEAAWRVNRRVEFDLRYNK